MAPSRGRIRKEIHEPARATELGPRLAEAQTSKPSAGSCFGSVGCRGGCDEDQPELVVRALAGVADEEVGRDDAFRPGELAVATLDLADDAPVPQVWVGGGREPPEAD